MTDRFTNRCDSIYKKVEKSVEELKVEIEALKEDIRKEGNATQRTRKQGRLSHLAKLLVSKMQRG